LRRCGPRHSAINFDDDLELHRLHMTDDLKREGNVPDAQRAYNAGPDKSKWSNKETTAYVGKIEAARVSPLSEVKKQVVVQPASERAPIPTVVAAVDSAKFPAKDDRNTRVEAAPKFAMKDDRRSRPDTSVPVADVIPAPKIASILQQDIPTPKQPAESPAPKVAALVPQEIPQPKQPPEAPAPKVASIVPQETPTPRPAPVEASVVKERSMTPDAPSARIPGDRSMILPPEPVQLPTGNPQEQAFNSRTQMDFSPLRVEGKFTLADQAGNQKADPIPYSGTFRRNMASGQQTVRA
jgi:hypothetical protein